MTITPPELPRKSIAQLQTLLAFLDNQLNWAESAALEIRACKETARPVYPMNRTHQAKIAAQE